jgi:hypothetical protein
MTDDGTVKNKRPFVELHDIPAGMESGADGMVLRDRLRGWAYRNRTLMCREKIHPFGMSREFGFRDPAQTVAVSGVSGENNPLC